MIGFSIKQSISKNTSWCSYNFALINKIIDEKGCTSQSSEGIKAISQQPPETTGFDLSTSNSNSSLLESQFSPSLQSLVSDIEKTQQHFIRCIKSNLTKSFNTFDGGEVLQQLKYAGMMETIRMWREEYDVCEKHQNVYNIFYILLYSNYLKRGERVFHLRK